MPTENKIAAPEESAGVDFGIDGRSVRVSQEAYSIFLVREAAGREKIAALQQRLTAADDRADVLEGLLRELRTIMKDKPVAMGRIDAALKPASSSGSVKLRPDGTLSNDIPAGQSGHIAIGSLDYGSLDAAQRLALCRGEQPAPVAVVPERLLGDDGVCTESHYASGWNNCLDELKRLNPSL